jgi:hypothetical protein
MTGADSSKQHRRNTREDVRTRALAQKDVGHCSKGAAAAERASAGIGVEKTEPTDWLFGSTLATHRSG